jgi:hypothetical protein
VKITYAYAADIVKAERDENGDLIVYGKATGPDLDLDQQICDPTWLKSAMPAWMEWGNIREMHQPIAAGVGIELEAKGDDWWLKSKCVDPNTAKKIEDGVLKGYSIGIKTPKVIKDAAAPGGRIVGGDIVETSYVDRPCNPTAKMAICKMVGDVMEPVEAEDADEKAADPELVKRAADLAAEVRALVPDLGKATPDQDCADAEAAVAAIARIIVSEAESLAAGQSCDAYQISCLLDAISALRWFIAQESDEADGAPMDIIVLDAEPDTTKAAPQPPTQTPDAIQAPEQPDLATLVKSAVAEANKTHEAELAALRAELTKVKAQPVPGGPVLARPVQDIAKAEARSTAIAQAQHYDRLAVELRATDPKTAQAYAEQARTLRANVPA